MQIQFTEGYSVGLYINSDLRMIIHSSTTDVQSMDIFERAVKQAINDYTDMSYRDDLTLDYENVKPEMKDDVLIINEWTSAYIEFIEPEGFENIIVEICGIPSTLI